MVVGTMSTVGVSNIDYFWGDTTLKMLKQRIAHFPGHLLDVEYYGCLISIEKCEFDIFLSDPRSFALKYYKEKLGL